MVKKVTQPPITLENRLLIIMNDDIAVIVVLSGVRDEEASRHAEGDGVLLVVAELVLW